MTAGISARGGAGGVEAHCEDMESTARLMGQCAHDAADQALRLHSYLLRPELLESAIFDPMGAARFEVGLLDALDGPHGIAVLAARCASLDIGLRAAAQAYRDTDQLSTALAPTLDFLRDAPHAGWDATSTLLTTGDVRAAAQRGLTDDPHAADVITGGLAARFGFTSVRQAARLLGGLYPDGQARVTAFGTDRSADRTGPPRSLAAIVMGLARRNNGRHGEIDVRVLSSAGGPRRVIVDIPGTKDWSPARHNGDITSIVTNVRALAGTSTSYERGVLGAMHDAGLLPTDDVLLVGHSEGGMVAVNAAIHASASGQFHVSHVVTAGAPIGAAAGKMPRNVQLLALENRGDVVPHLDDAENPDRVNITTVEVRHDHGSVGANHALADSYVPGAADVDGSTEATTRAYLDGLRPFLSAEAVTTHTFQVTRVYP